MNINWDGMPRRGPERRLENKGYSPNRRLWVRRRGSSRGRNPIWNTLSRAWAVTYKEGSCCALCGYRRLAGALEFHHLDPKIKRFNLSQFITLHLAEILEEAAKCVILCANCHAEVEGGIAEVPAVGLVLKLVGIPRTVENFEAFKRFGDKVLWTE